MEKFNRTLRGYDPEEVNAFLDKIIGQVEYIVEDNKNKEDKIKELETLLEENKNSKDNTNELERLMEENKQAKEALETLEEENKRLIEKQETYKRMEETLNKAIIMAQKTSEQIKLNAYNESEVILDDARGNANRIVNEALMRAEKTEHEAELLKRNMNIFKKRIKDIVEAQLEIVNEFDKIEL